MGKPEEVRAVGIPRHQLENNSDIRFKKKKYGRTWAKFICIGLGTSGVLF